MEGHRPGHGIALEPAQRGADVVVPRLQRVRTAIQRRRAEVPPLRHRQSRPAAAILRVCGLRGPARRDADPRRGGTLRRAEPGADLSPVGRRRGGAMDGRQRLGAAPESRRRGPLGERGQAADAQGLGRGPGLARACQGLPDLPIVRADVAPAGAGEGRWWPPQRQGREEAGRHRPHGRLPAPGKQPRAAGDQHRRADRGPAAARAGALASARRISGPRGACRWATRSWPGYSISSCWVRASWTSSWRGRGRPGTPRPATACSRWPSSTPAWAAAATWSGSRSSSTRPPSRPSSIWTTRTAKRPATAA